MREFKVKGISWRCDNTFYVDVYPSQEMYYAYDWVLGEFQQKDENYDNYCDVAFLNVAVNLDNTTDFNLSSYFSEHGWVDISYMCSKEEKKMILKFIEEWKDKVPENPDGNIYWDDTEYTNALSDDITWKEEVLR